MGFVGGALLLVFANKQDAPGAVTPHEVQARFHLQTATHGGPRQPTNVLGAVARSGQGVEEGIVWLVEVLQSHSRTISLTNSGASGWDRTVSAV